LIALDGLATRVAGGAAEVTDSMTRQKTAAEGLALPAPSGSAGGSAEWPPLPDPM
jgi:hypothetical protein